MQIDGTSALVTGAASGLGLATARRLVSCGARVVLLDLPSSPGPEVAKELGDNTTFVAAAGGLFRLPRKIPVNVAMEMALTGEPMDAVRAHALGLVNHLCEPGRALHRAMELGFQIEANAPIAVRASRRVLLASLGQDEGIGWQLSDAAMAEAMSSDDMQEGMKAFLEKRDPRWSGK